MAGIDTKIMAFVGTDECSSLITRLAEHTDSIYAAVSSNYGQSSFPGGNITIISSYLDDAGIQRWIDRAGIGMIIDGIDETAREECALVRRKAEENGIEYYRIADHLKISNNIKICATEEELISSLTYSNGRILAEGSESYFLLTGSGVDPERIFVMTRPDEEEIRQLKEAGCREEQILSFGMIIHQHFILSLFDELKIRHYVLRGGLNRGITEKTGALNHSDVRAYINGALADQDGHTVKELWKLLSRRYGLRD